MEKKSKFNVNYKEPEIFGNKQFHILSEGLSCDEVMTEICSLHWHDEIEFSLITEGESKFFIENEEFDLQKYDVAFINGKQIHMRQNSPLCKCSYFSIAIDSKFLGATDFDDIFLRFIAPILNRSITVNTFFSGKDESNHFLIETLEKISRVLDRKDYAYELLIRAYIYEIIFWIYQNHKYTISDIHKESPAIKEIRKITEYINDNFMKDITIGDLAKLSNLSNDYLIRVFTKYAHQTPINYVNSIRLHKAAQLLTNRDLSISEIALTVGFNNISYFSKIFKREYHSSPSDYRNNYFNRLS